MIIDMNVSLGNWPFMEFAINSPAQLAKHLTDEGITRAYIRSCQATFLPEPENDNRKLVDALQPYDNLLPVPTINPTLIGWNKMVDWTTTPVVNSYPNYHQYELDSAAMQALAEQCIASETLLFITMRMEDIRGSHPLCIIPDVSAAAVKTLAAKHPQLKIICLNCNFSEAVDLTAASDNIYIDIAYCECGSTIKNMLKHIAQKQMLFGSHTPLFYTRAALMKLKHAETELTAIEAISYTNAQNLNL